MNIEEIRDYCLSLPLATEDMAFGEDYILFRIMNHIFCCIGMVRTDYCVVKLPPEANIEYRELYPEIEPAWHWNKKYWSQINLSGRLPDSFIQELIRKSYAEVVKKLPRKTKAENPVIATIS